MNYVKDLEVRHIVMYALKEDIGLKDITTEAFIPKGKTIKAVLLTKEDCVICGLGVAALVFRLQDKNIKFKPLVRAGSRVKKGTIIARVSGKARAILSAERVALNFLSHLSGISTQTRKFVKQVTPYKAKIMDTRKTIPGLRLLEKYAVRIGGGFNHRLSLDEMVLIKDNHVKIIGGINKLAGFKRKYRIEIEVKNLREFKEALKARPDIIMLDNMNIKDIKKAVKIRNYLSPNTYHLTPKLEVSGGVTLNNVRQIAKTGVDMISIGALTQSLTAADISLEIL